MGCGQARRLDTTCFKKIHMKEASFTHPKESIKVLDEAIHIQLQKAHDYQNDNSSVKQIDYYPRGCASIYDMMNTKMLRIKSVMDAVEAKPNHGTNFESLEDSAIDLINYTTFFVEYLRGKMQGQDKNKDIFNKTPTPIIHNTNKEEK